MKLNKSKSTDGKGLTTHFNGLRKANNAVTVGVQPDAHDYPDGTSVILIATLGEFGDASRGLVPRHFLSRAVEADKDFYKHRVKFILKAYDKDPKLINLMMRQLGIESQTKVKAHVEHNTIGMAGNKPSTAFAKGGNQPMIDTGHLVRQIESKTERNK